MLIKLETTYKCKTCQILMECKSNWFWNTWSYHVPHLLIIWRRRLQYPLPPWFITRLSRKNCDITIGITCSVTAYHHKAEIFMKSVCLPSPRVVQSADSFESRPWSELAREMPSGSHVLQHFTNDSRMCNSVNDTSTASVPFPRDGYKNFFFSRQQWVECNDELWAIFIP
jgi:hypothetical protein